jgi:hypothetical protein
LRGVSNPPLTAAYFGFVNSETELVLTTPPLLGTTADESSPIADYPITVSGATATNYTISFTNGVLHVTGDDAPELVLNAEGQEYHENDPPLLLDPEVAVTDFASPNFDGGRLTLTINTGARATDQILLLPGGAGAEAVSLAGTNALVNGVLIGWFEGGTNGTTPWWYTSTPTPPRPPPRRSRAAWRIKTFPMILTKTFASCAGT